MEGEGGGGGGFNDLSNPWAADQVPRPNLDRLGEESAGRAGPSVAWQRARVVAAGQRLWALVVAGEEAAAGGREVGLSLSAKHGLGLAAAVAGAVKLHLARRTGTGVADEGALVLGAVEVLAACLVARGLALAGAAHHHAPGRAAKACLLDLRHAGWAWARMARHIARVQAWLAIGPDDHQTKKKKITN